MAGELKPGPADVDEELLGEVQSELERSAEDLARLTERVQEQTAVVERLEFLVTEVLNLVPAPAVVVDPDCRIAAVSQGARDTLRRVSTGTPGEQAASALPADVVEIVREVARSTPPAFPDANTPPAAHAREPSRWISAPGARIMALTEGWTLVVLES